MTTDAEITDVEFAPPAAEAAADIDAPAASDVAAAAQAVVDAAVRARVAETSGSDDDPEHLQEQHDAGQLGDWQMPDPGQWSWVLEKFQYFYERDYYLAEAAAAHVTDAEAQLKSGRLSAIGNVQGVVEDWAGDARDDFKQFFLDPFVSQTVTNQQSLFEELAVVMYAYDGMLKQARIDAKTVADETVKVLDSLFDCSSDDVKMALTVAGSAIGICGLVPVAGPFVFTMGVIGTAISTVNTGIDVSKQKIYGGTVADVMNSLETVLDNLKTVMDAEEQSIANAITELQGEVDGYLGSSSELTKATLLPNEPADDVANITDGEAPPEDQFRPKH